MQTLALLPDRQEYSHTNSRMAKQQTKFVLSGGGVYIYGLRPSFIVSNS